jgi:hypothetical protein
MLFVKRFLALYAKKIRIYAKAHEAFPKPTGFWYKLTSIGGCK